MSVQRTVNKEDPSRDNYSVSRDSFGCVSRDDWIVDQREDRRSSVDSLLSSRRRRSSPSATLLDEYAEIAVAFAEKRISAPAERPGFVSLEKRLHGAVLGNVVAEPPVRPAEDEATATDLAVAEAMDATIASYNDTIRTRYLAVTQDREAELTREIQQRRAALEAACVKVAMPALLTKLETDVLLQGKTPQDYALLHRQAKQQYWTNGPEKTIEWWRQRLVELITEE